MSRLLPLIVAVLLALTAFGCSKPSPSKFAPEDAEELRRLCGTPPYPTSLDHLRRQAGGHLKEVLADREAVSAQAYINAVILDGPEGLGGGIAVIAMEDRDSKVVMGLMLVLLDPDGRTDLFQFDKMFPELAPSAVPEATFGPLETYPFNWWATDNQPDFATDALFVIDPMVEGRLLTDEGKPRFQFRWMGP